MPAKFRNSMAGSVIRSSLAVIFSVSTVIPPLTNQAICSAKISPNITTGVNIATQSVNKKEVINHSSLRFSARAYELKTGMSAALTIPPANKS